MLGAPPASLLVIGIGSELRGDDAAGRMVAARVEALNLDGVRVRSVVQLVPELVEDLASCTDVVFVDASLACTVATTRWLEPTPGVAALTHHTTPEGLLGLAATVGVTPPRAALIAVPAPSLGLGDRLSVLSRAGIEQAVELIARLHRARHAPIRRSARRSRTGAA